MCVCACIHVYVRECVLSVLVFICCFVVLTASRTCPLFSRFSYFTLAFAFGLWVWREAYGEYSQLTQLRKLSLFAFCKAAKYRTFP